MIWTAFAANHKEPEEAHFGADPEALYQRVSQMTPVVGEDVLFVDREETVVFDAEGRAVRSRYFLYKVLTQKGVHGWDDVSSYWEPWREERPRLRVRVINSDGTVHALDENTITEAPAKEDADHVFSDRRVVRAPLPAVTPGSLVEEEVILTEKEPLWGAGTVERFYFGSSVALQHSRLVLDAPTTLPLRYEVHLLTDLETQRNEADGRVRITFDHGLMDAIDTAEAELPSDVPAYPSVTFSTGISWQKVAEKYGEIVDTQIAGSDLKALVGKVTTSHASRDEKARAILQYLDREVRYTGIEFGESEVVPHPPSETIARKYGDCKDKASLLVAMLRADNVPAYLALLNAGDQEDVSSDLPGMGIFDHAIVYVPGTPDLWIDATDEYARLGDLPGADQGRLALIVRPETDRLMRTPAASSTDNLLIEKREIFLAETGPARIIETSQPHGAIESSYRRAYADKENKSAKDDLSSYMKGQYLAEKLDRMERSDPNDVSKQFELLLESDRARRGSTDLDTAAAAIRLEGLFSRLPADLRQRANENEKKTDKDNGQKPEKKRSADYQLPQAFVTEWDYSVVPPSGFQPKPLPPNANLSFGPSTLREEFAADQNGVVHATLRFDTVKRRMTVSETTELRDKIVQVLEGEPIVIYFEPVGQALLSQGKTREALRSYHDLIAAHPKDAVHHLRLAKAFLSAGLGGAARSEAQAAVKLEPASAVAEKTLADVLEYDLVGRKFRPGSDYSGAEVAYRAAENLDPEDKATVANLAILLEFNQWGLRYGPGARLKDAVAEYRKLSSEKLAELGVQNNLAYTLFYERDFLEARKYAETLNPQPGALIVACEAGVNGTQAALTEAKKRSASEGDFKATAKVAGDMLVNLRKYQTAADLEDAGASGDTASDIAANAALYRKAVPHEQLKFTDDPTGAAIKLSLLQWDPNLTIEQLQSVMSKNGRTGFETPSGLTHIIRNAKARLSRLARRGEFSDVRTDLWVTRVKPKAQGNDVTGYKIVYAGENEADYVVKADGEYKILGYSIYHPGLAEEALDRIAANDLAGARVLFDWLREDEHLEGGDDPMDTEAFPRFWTRGKTADAAMMKLTAASILVQYDRTAAQGIAMLEAARDSLTNDPDRVNVSLALLRGYATLDQPNKALSICQSLAKQYPESKRLFRCESANLRKLGRFNEAEKLAQEMLQRSPSDIDAMQALSYAAIAREDYDAARIPLQELNNAGKARASDLNSLAWYALFKGEIESTDIQFALRAAELGNKNASYLHTLGCVYAAAGQVKKARDVLVEAMDALDLDEPTSDYWYAFGLIAEQYGERDLALSYYSRVTKPEKAYEIPGSSYRLAQIRIQALHDQK